MIEACRLAPGEAMPGWDRVVIGVDPPAGSADGKGDACGIVVLGVLGRETAVVLADASVDSGQPHVWAAAVARAAAHWGADRVIAEANNGGEMVAAVLRAADSALPVKLVHAARGKAARAEPVALKYEAGKVRHAAAFPALEDQLCGMTIGGGYDGPGRSPDRADALVWAVTEGLLKERSPLPSVRSLAPDRGPPWWVQWN